MASYFQIKHLTKVDQPHMSNELLLLKLQIKGIYICSEKLIKNTINNQRFVKV